MRRLLDSSWIKFGPAGRDDWVSGSPSPPTAEQRLQIQAEQARTGNIIALDLQDPERNAEILSSLTGNAERLNSSSSDLSDGVFLMVYLPPPYEDTLTKITRAASLSSGKDVESIKIEDLEAKLCPELISSGEFV
ncbi:hypothetical protein G5714_000351 [Onychostoma macrolepis]|uniref:Uncharacterized protein n=1 Tax=Onychostoma macrolepis TaxID=369639 RepID=A0A7J6DG99_9TELE|nr:hypothetical protein G5714_000351 [Onychostoma macrolepis]